VKSGRRLAFDFGEVRIGVAISDFSGILASPLTTLVAKSETLTGEIGRLVREYDPIYLVVGNPMHLSGNQSQKSDSVQEFVNSLMTITSAPIFLVDERLSTINALRELRAAGKNAKSAKEKVDQVAAVTILELAMSQERNFGTINGISI
jgi:putative Holliday junction resolvase